MTAGDKYQVEMTHNGEKISFIFNDNINNNAGKKDFLFALLSDAVAFESSGCLQTFMWSYGYEDSDQANKIYLACEKQAEKLHKLFTDEEIEMLGEIFEDY